MTILEVNGVPIPATAIRTEAARLRQQARDEGHEVTVDEAVDVLNEAERLVIERALLDQEAERLAIAVEPAEVDAALARMLPPHDANTACRGGTDRVTARAEVERRLKIDVLAVRWTKDVKPPSERTIRQVYLKQRDQLRVPEFVQVEQILKNVNHADERDRAMAAMEGIAAELARGADFAALAVAHSDCPERGGALGFVTRGEMVPEFDDVVFALPLNQPSGVFETRFGFHIVKVTERIPAGPLPLERAAPRIARALLDSEIERLIQTRMDDLRARATIRRVKV